MSSPAIVIIGAGIGGLTTAALLAKAGHQVTVLEAHVYGGGCAGTFFHKGYRFDAGATLAGGFYPGGPMDLVAAAAGVSRWPAQHDDPALVVHLPDGSSVARWGDERRFAAHETAFGPAAQPFFAWQERTADLLWDLALRIPPWPPQSRGDLITLLQKGIGWLGHNFPHYLRPTLLADAIRPVAAHLHHVPERLRLFIDAQLVIAAQTTSKHANALYGASALDLPRRGVVHLAGGMGAIAETLVETVRKHGGQVHFRQEVTRIRMANGRPVGVETKRGTTYPADLIIANLPPWNITPLLGEALPSSLRQLSERPADGWGACMLYVGVDAQAIPADFPLHHQVIVREPMGEGNTVFLSLSPAWDSTRAPAGQRALTISTHTALTQWWQLYQTDEVAYEVRKAAYTERMLAAATKALPSLHENKAFVMPGTPVTFQRFTRRAWGWVGGFPQTNLFRTWGPKLGPGLWMVGDSIFPGQSTAAVALGGMRVAQAILADRALATQRQVQSAAPTTPPLAKQRSQSA